MKNINKIIILKDKISYILGIKDLVTTNIQNRKSYNNGNNKVKKNRFQQFVLKISKRMPF